MTNLKYKSFLLTNPHIKGMVKAMKSAGLRVIEDEDAGTVEAFYKDTQVYWAIQKGNKNQPWIVRHVENLFD